METIRKKFLAFYEENKDKKFVISTHRKADLDSFVSAYALHTVFPNSLLATPDTPNEAVQQLMEKLKVKMETLGKVKKGGYEGLIVCDTSAYTLLEEAKKWNIVAIVDHHRAEGRDMKSEHEFWDDHSPSTAEIVANILPQVSRQQAHVLALGIISDTARFKSARQSTFATLAKMMEICGANYAELLDLAEPELPDDLKIAVIKAMQRMEYRIIGRYVVVTSEVGSGEGEASSFLSDIADVCFIASWKAEKQQTHISSRARKHVTAALHEVMKEVSVQLNGNGGGHPKAAGAAVKAKPAEALQVCLDVLSRKLGS
ncbi:MAG TPA: DHH family phosphoesterase [Candidatus Bilamarchaeaceae archaeon]|nr:DHH family phosphoesterase [Candidatus Bilamarchaeaceae archaeon]